MLNLVPKGLKGFLHEDYRGLSILSQSDYFINKRLWVAGLQIRLIPYSFHLYKSSALSTGHICFKLSIYKFNFMFFFLSSIPNALKNGGD